VAFGLWALIFGGGGGGGVALARSLRQVAPYAKHVHAHVHVVAYVRMAPNAQNPSQTYGIS